MTTGPALAPVLGLWGYLLLRHSRRARGRLVLIFNSEAEELREGWQWNYGFELVSLARVFKVIEESSTLTDDNSKTNSCYKRENTNCCLVKQKKQEKNPSIVLYMNTQWLPPILQSMFPFGRDCRAFPSMTSSHWPTGGPRGGQIHPDICNSKSPFASSASKMGHYSRLKPHPAKWKQQGDLWPKTGEEVGEEARGLANRWGVKRHS